MLYTEGTSKKNKLIPDIITSEKYSLPFTADLIADTKKNINVNGVNHSV